MLLGMMYHPFNMLTSNAHLSTVTSVWNKIPNILREKNYECFKNELKKSNILDKISFKLTGRAFYNKDYVY